MDHTRCWIVLALLLLAAAPGIARAQVDSRDDEARALFTAGHTAFEDGRFADALPDFQRAYDLSHRPELLYNIGQCHEHLRHDSEAVAAFESYLAAVPDAPNRRVLEARIAVLRGSSDEAATDPSADAQPEPLAERPPPDVTPAAEVAPAPSSSASPGPVGPILIGVGAAVAVVGAILVGVAFADIGSVQSASEVPYSSVREADQRAPIESGVGWAALAVGLAVATVGIVVLATSSNATRTTVTATPGTLTISGVF